MPFVLGSVTRVVSRSAILLALTVSLCWHAAGQDSDALRAAAIAPHPLITQAVDDSRLATLKGNTHPLARPEFDLGAAPASMPMSRMLLVLKRSREQESALEQLLDDQQNKNSPNYHKWMTPEQFGQQFGPTDADMQTITSWLQSHGFQVGTTKGRAVVEFSGSASQVQEAFHTTIHKYLVKGEQHWANVSDPQIPAALTSVIAGLASMNNFPRKAMNAPAGRFTRDASTGKIQPDYTFPGGCVENNFVNGSCVYGLGPYDFATIYDVQPLWTAGINGTGQTIAIVGETNINVQDVADFRSMFGLPVNNPNVILNGPDPGIQGDESEADIDVQWSGAVAPNATIDFVVSQSTETTAGIDLSAVYIIENNLAPVMSESYGYCELGLGTSGNQFYNSLWQQAAAEGITVFISAGDNGAAGCDDFNAAPPAPAEFGLQVSGFASTPYNIAVGGTDFNDFSNPSTYWSPTNNLTTQASALSYIPETTWNDSCTNSIFGTVGYSTNAETNCNDSRLINFVSVEGGSGGVSKCTTPSGSTAASCAGGYAKPSWQSGSGVPADGKRDLPDVSLFASNGFLGNFYIICQSDQTSGPCNLPGGQFLGFGGTSVSSPAFAGIMALVNQQTASRQGNANYVFYKLAAQQPSAFHDVTSGTIAMPCQTGSTNCATITAGHQYGILSGYSTGTKYDLATGLGSVDANNLVTKWTSVTLLPSTTTLTNVAPTTITHGQAVSFTATVAPTSGTGTPTGLVSLEGGPSNSIEGIAGFSLASGTVSGSTELLPGGTYSLKAHYPGDSTYGPSDSSPISVTVNKENSQPQVFLVTFDSTGSILSGNTTTALYGSPYLLRVNVENSAGQMCAPVAASAATECPTGSITLTNNGTALDAGTYALNTDGYVEDQSIQLPGGTDSVKAAYAGDNSFNASSVTTPISITPAATTMTTPNVLGSATVGQSISLNAYVNTTSSGAGPTGTVTFYANGTAIGGTLSLVPVSGGPTSSAYALANLASNTNVFPTPGSYAITASYGGDSNYSVSTSSAYTIPVQYPTPSLTLTPAQQNISPGGTATVAILVDTMAKALYPTGTVTFVNQQTGATLAGPTTCASTNDSSGNDACQASGSFTLNTSTTIIAKYSGDANFPPSSSGYAFVNVPNFSLSQQNATTITQGQSQTLMEYVNPSGGFTGTVTFSCSGLPAETTCTFNPTQVTTQGSTVLTITTTPLGQSRKRASLDRSWSAATEGMFLVGACLIGIPLWRRRRTIPQALVIFAFLAALPSCGGGGGGGGSVTNNPVPSISSLSPSSLAAGSAGHTLVVTGSGFNSSSTVTYNGIAHSVLAPTATQFSIGLTASDLASTGSFPVVVSNPTPGGGSSAPTDFNVVTGTPTGTVSFTVTGTSGSLTNSITFPLTVQ
jgi:subtilase family serine protease